MGILGRLKFWKPKESAGPDGSPLDVVREWINDDRAKWARISEEGATDSLRARARTAVTVLDELVAKIDAETKA